MTVRLLILLVLFLKTVGCTSLQGKDLTFNISDDLVVTKLNDRSFNVKDISFYNSNVFVSKMKNGTVIIASSFIDTVKTDQLMRWITQTLEPKKIIAINTHFHADGTGGNEGYTKHGVEIWSTKETHNLYQRRADSMRTNLAKFVKNERLSRFVLSRKNLPAHKFFEAKEGKKWKFNDEEVVAYHPGPGHTSDNIIVYFPDQKILFGGCLLRAKSWKSLGNTEDANVNQYYSSVKSLLSFKADIVIPGHGDIGGTDLIHHTMAIADKAKNGDVL